MFIASGFVERVWITPWKKTYDLRSMAQCHHVVRLSWCKVVLFWIHKLFSFVAFFDESLLGKLQIPHKNMKTNQLLNILNNNIIYRCLCNVFHYKPPRFRVAIQSRACKLNTCNTLYYITLHYLTSTHLAVYYIT